MKMVQQIKLSLLSVAAAGIMLSGCSLFKKESEHSYIDETQVSVIKLKIPEGYLFTETWKGTERGGAALRTPAYEHVLASPYAINDPAGERYIDQNELYTQVLLTSLANSANASGGRGMVTQPPKFCDENRSLLIPNTAQSASRTEYMQIRERYCSTPGYRLSQHEIDVLNGGEPQELRDYRIRMYVDNQFNIKN